MSRGRNLATLFSFRKSRATIRLRVAITTSRFRLVEGAAFIPLSVACILVRYVGLSHFPRYLPFNFIVQYLEKRAVLKSPLSALNVFFFMTRKQLQ